MDNYKSLGLDSNMFNLTSPLVQRDFTTGFDFVTQNERGAVTKAFIGNAAIGTAQIEDASITNAKLGTAVIGTANIGTLSFNEISGGTISVVGNLGGTNVKLDGPNRRIVINDGTVDRIIIGSI